MGPNDLTCNVCSKAVEKDFIFRRNKLMRMTFERTCFGIHAVPVLMMKFINVILYLSTQDFYQLK